jgi:hypothetical protein
MKGKNIMAKNPVESPSGPNEVEHSPKISQVQLNNAKLYSSREEYAKTLPKGIRYLEVGVAWGYSAELFAGTSEASKIDLLDLYNQDLKCWSWRQFGSCQCDGMKHELLYLPETHEQYIKDKFKDYKNVRTLQGNAPILMQTLDEEYDFIYIDITNERKTTKACLQLASERTAIGGIVGMNDYLIYDGIIEDQLYGTFQTVNWFLHLHPNWSVDALALHNLGFYDIYLKRNS